MHNAFAPAENPFRICLAPMMDRTDMFFRVLTRLISPRVRLYSEMVTADAVNHGDRSRLLARAECEAPVALQLGGSDPNKLAEAAAHAEEAGFDEVNLNCGCPSDRVQSGAFGACLLADPLRVADCVAAMRDAVGIPVTVKTRIALDRATPESMLWPFIERVAGSGCETFIIHARPAWLEGLSPKENREVPPLDYEVVARLKADFPKLTIALNGGIQTAQEMAQHLARFDGVMLGRAAYDTPWVFAEFDRLEGVDGPDRADVLSAYAEFAKPFLMRGVPPRAVLRHVLGMYTGAPGARAFRRRITEALAGPLKADPARGQALAEASIRCLLDATSEIEQGIADRRARMVTLSRTQ